MAEEMLEGRKIPEQVRPPAGDAVGRAIVLEQADGHEAIEPAGHHAGTAVQRVELGSGEGLPAGRQQQLHGDAAAHHGKQKDVQLTREGEHAESGEGG
jgi:hypothetical protein